MKSNIPGPDSLAELPEAPLEAPPPELQTEPARPRRRGIWIAGAILAAIAVVVAISRSGKSSDAKKAAAAKARAQAPVPVVVAEAQTADFPVSLSGLGHRHAALDGHGPLAGRRRADAGGVQRGPARRARTTCSPRSIRARSRSS